MRILIAVIAGVVAGLVVRLLTSPAVKEITAPAPTYAESHAETVKKAEEKVAEKRQAARPLNPAYTEPLYVRGYIARGEKVNVCLSDGTTWTERTEGLELIERKHVVFRGKAYALMGSGAPPARPEAVERTERTSAPALDLLAGLGLPGAASGTAALPQPALD